MDTPAGSTTFIPFNGPKPPIRRAGIDVGMYSVNIIYFRCGAPQNEDYNQLAFSRFERSQIGDCVAFVQSLVEDTKLEQESHSSPFTIIITSRSPPQFQERFRALQGVEVRLKDGFECLSSGAEYLITKVPQGVFTYSEDRERHYLTAEPQYPYLLVNIGSGVSFWKVSDSCTSERVGGTTLGAATLCSLLSLTTKCKTYAEMLDLAEQGDNSTVDKLIRDIYSTDYNAIGFKSTAVASSFGKVFSLRGQLEQPTKETDNSAGQGLFDYAPPIEAYPFADADVCRSLIFAIFNNIGQLANLQAQLHGATDIYFGGSYVRNHNQTMSTLRIAVNFYSKGLKKSAFLSYGGSLGAIGAFLDA